LRRRYAAARPEESGNTLDR